MSIAAKRHQLLRLEQKHDRFDTIVRRGHELTHGQQEEAAKTRRQIVELEQELASADAMARSSGKQGLLRKHAGCSWYSPDEREDVSYTLDLVDEMEPYDLEQLVKSERLQRACLDDLLYHRTHDLRSAASFFLHALGEAGSPFSSEPGKQIRVAAYTVPDDICQVDPPDVADMVVAANDAMADLDDEQLWSAFHDPVIRAVEEHLREKHRDTSQGPAFTTVPFCAMMRAFRDYRLSLVRWLDLAKYSTLLTPEDVAHREIVARGARQAKAAAAATANAVRARLAAGAAQQQELGAFAVCEALGGEQDALQQVLYECDIAWGKRALAGEFSNHGAPRIAELENQCEALRLLQSASSRREDELKVVGAMAVLAELSGREAGTGARKELARRAREAAAQALEDVLVESARACGSTRVNLAKVFDLAERIEKRIAALRHAVAEHPQETA